MRYNCSFLGMGAALRGLAVVAALVAPVAAQSPPGCQSGDYTVNAPVPVQVTVSCAGSTVRSTIQWPFTPPSEWHRAWMLDTVNETLNVYMAGTWTAAVTRHPHPDGGAPIYDGCPDIWGGSSDPGCWRKLKILIGREYLVLEQIEGQNAGAATMCAFVDGFPATGTPHTHDPTIPGGAPNPGGVTWSAPPGSVLEPVEEGFAAGALAPRPTPDDESATTLPAPEQPEPLPDVP